MGTKLSEVVNRAPLALVVGMLSEKCLSLIAFGAESDVWHLRTRRAVWANSSRPAMALCKFSGQAHSLGMSVRLICNRNQKMSEGSGESDSDHQPPYACRGTGRVSVREAFAAGPGQ